jgi:hypothetical protein
MAQWENMARLYQQEGDSNVSQNWRTQNTN